MVAGVGGTSYPQPPKDSISVLSFQPGALPQNSITKDTAADVPKPPVSSGRLHEVGQMCKAAGKGFAGVFGVLGIAAASTAALLTQGLFLAHMGVTGAMGVVGGVSLAAMCLFASAPIFMVLPEESTESDFVFDISATVGAVAGAAVPVALMAIGSLGLAAPYFASKALMDGSSRLLQHAGVAERKLETYKNFVLFMETLSSGKKFVVKTSDDAVPVDLPTITLAERLQRYNLKLVNDPKDHGYIAYLWHLLGTHGIGSSYFVPVQEESGQCKYVTATELRKQFGFSANETHRISRMRPQEAVAMCTQLYAKKEMQRKLLITNLAQALQQPMNTFTKNEYTNACHAYDKEGFSPDHLLQEAYALLKKDQKEKHQGMYQLWRIGIKRVTTPPEKPIPQSDCQSGIDWAKKTGCLAEFLERLKEISPRLAKLFEEHEELFVKKVAQYEQLLRLREEEKKKAFCYERDVFSSEEKKSEIFREALIDAARRVNPDDPQKVLFDLKELFNSEIQRLEALPISEVSDRWQYDQNLTALRARRDLIPI